MGIGTHIIYFGELGMSGGGQASSVHWVSVPLGTPGNSVEHTSEFSASCVGSDAEGL